MAWLTKPSGTQQIERRDEPYLTDELKDAFEKRYAHRYPTRAAMALPILHEIQHHYNWLPYQALEEAAAFLEMEPSSCSTPRRSTKNTSPSRAADIRCGSASR
ncbi:MAG: NAD(P)H-dependent oxidoreductase subunit E [Planctomycetota bacterium]